jgi:hypothetical protein
VRGILPRTPRFARGLVHVTAAALGLRLRPPRGTTT